MGAKLYNPTKNKKQKNATFIPSINCASSALFTAVIQALIAFFCFFLYLIISF